MVYERKYYQKLVLGARVENHIKVMSNPPIFSQMLLSYKPSNLKVPKKSVLVSKNEFQKFDSLNLQSH